MYHIGNCGGVVGNPPTAAGCVFCANSETDLLTGKAMDSSATCAGGRTPVTKACSLDRYQNVKIRGEAYPNKYAYYYVIPPNNYMTLRVVARTVDEQGNLFDTARLGDNIDLYVKKGGTSVPRYRVHNSTDTFIASDDLPVYANSHYDFTSVRESNPWAIDVGRTTTTCVAERLSQDADIYDTTSCRPYIIAIMGDNQFPQKSGASQFEMYWYYDFDFNDFACSNAPVSSTYTTVYQKCPYLEYESRYMAAKYPSANVARRMLIFPGITGLAGISQSIVSDTNAVFNAFPAAPTTAAEALVKQKNLANFVSYTDSNSNTVNVMRLVTSNEMNYGATGTDTQVTKVQGSVYFNEDLELAPGFEVNFKFRISNQKPCGSEDGFCGGGDGFAFVTHQPLDDFDPLPLEIVDDTYVLGNWQSDSHGLRGFGTFYDSVSDYIQKKAILGSTSTNAVGSTLGYANVSRSLAIEFDTWHNPNLYDPKQGIEHWWINATEFVSYADNHIAFFSHGHMPNSADHSSDALIAATPSIPNLSDQQIHSVKIWYFPRAGIYPGSLSIFIDNMDRPALVADVTMVGPMKDPAGYSCVGPKTWIKSYTVYGPPTTGTDVVIVTAAMFTNDHAYTTASTKFRVWPRTLSFTALNWWIPQQVFITANPDSDSTVDSADLQLSWTAGNSAASPTNYRIPSAVTLIDTDSVNVLITESGQLFTDASGAPTGKRTYVGHAGIGRDTFTAQLTQKPGYKDSTNYERVTVTFSGAIGYMLEFSLDAVTFSSSVTVTFTANNFNVPQTITVKSADGTTITHVYPIANTTSVAITTVIASTAVGTGFTSLYSSATALKGVPPAAGDWLVDIVDNAALITVQTNGFTAVRSGTTGENVPDTIRFTPINSANVATMRSATFSSQVGTDSSATCLGFSTAAPLTSNYVTATIWPAASGGVKSACDTATSATTITAPAPLHYPLEVTTGTNHAFYPTNIVNVYYVPTDAEDSNHKSTFVVPPTGTAMDNEILETSYERCVLDKDGKAYVGFTGAVGDATQDMDIHSWSFCHKPGCVAY